MSVWGGGWWGGVRAHVLLYRAGLKVPAACSPRTSGAQLSCILRLMATHCIAFGNRSDSELHTLLKLIKKSC